MEKYVVTSIEDYNECVNTLLEMHPVGFNIITKVRGDVISRTYLFEDMLEWLVREYPVEFNGEKKTCIEYFDHNLGSVCVAYK